MSEPIRTCIGCRKKATKWELVRMVRNDTGQVSVDESRKNPGRGAYVCLNPQCIELALTSKKLNKVLKTNLAPKAIESLKQVLINLLHRLESSDEGR
ncbi:YlxR family protein [Candidatus Poribacteria bacterium]|nr:YlxR family protein [Candidatus Poribacteria bacterium]